MTRKQKEVVGHRLARARETLAAAKVLEDSHFHFSAINRLYYACFYAVTALLASQGLASSKHPGVLALFNRHFVKTDIVSKRLGKFFGDLFDTRHEGDYSDFATFTSEELTELHESAANFVEEISCIIEPKSR